MPGDLIVGGPNGAGKTTFALEYLAGRPLPFLSADAIATEINPEAPDQAKTEAGKAFFRRLGALIQGRGSFVAESTLAGLRFARVMERLQAEGYTVTLVFIFLVSPDVCVARVQERVRKGGHHVPEADVRRRYHRSKRNFWDVYRLKADRWKLYHNTTEGFQGVATGKAMRMWSVMKRPFGGS
ncbi:MAG: AAA family ATPase [Rhodothermales bacterium]